MLIKRKVEIIISKRQQIIRNNVINVFHQSQAKDVKNKFKELPVYPEKFLRKLKIKENAFLLLDDLVLRDLVKKNIILTRSPTTQIFTYSVFIIGIADEAITKTNTED
ncbi:8449_t:CDS:1 [Funneliformis geosporum]|uniref:8449_t:CDS:1 n=1 Tax=Funneliformis geosporum TaxID=1117311 RepID=A0A9W4T5G0_9GLOM|nr:8449_t:CDS:1 [Funneliformis geosporum]